jgi:hypothetical protein
VRREQRLQAGEVQVLLPERHGVGDGVGREQLQGDRHVPEGEVEVDDDDAAAPLVRQRGRQVGGDRRLAAPPLGGEDGDHAARGHLGRRVGGRRAVGERVADLVAATDGIEQTGPVVGRDHLTDPCPQCLGEHAGVDVVPHQHHAHLGRTDRNVLARSTASSSGTSAPSTTVCAPPEVASSERTSSTDRRATVSGPKASSTARDDVTTSITAPPRRGCRLSRLGPAR